MVNLLVMKLLVEKIMLWYQRLGHDGEKGLRALKNKILIEGLNDCNLELNFCEHCVYEKQYHVPFFLVLISLLWFDNSMMNH